MWLCIFMAICWALLLRQQPRYDGKTVLELSRMVAPGAGERRLLGWTDQQASDALIGLRALGPRAEKALINQLQTQDTAWLRAYRTLWLRSPSSAKHVLPPPLNPAYTRQLAAAALGKLSALSPRSEVALRSACRDIDPIVRARAALVLGYRGSRAPETLRAIEEAMRDPQVSNLVGGAVGEFDFRPRTVEDMTTGLSRPFREARYDAASALRDLGPGARSAIPALIEACRDPEIPVRLCCVRALGRIGVAASNAAPTLRGLLNDESSMVRQAAAEAIQEVGAR